MKRKIFTLITALVLSIGSMWAQELRDADMQKNVASATSNGSRKAPQATQGVSLSWSWTWDEFDHNGVDAQQVGVDGQNVIYKYEWWRNKSSYPCTRIVICYKNAEGVMWEGDKFPPKGTYSVNWQEGAGRIACYQTTNDYYWVYDDARWYSMVYNSSGTQMKYYSGDFYFEEGADGPYIHTTNLVLANKAYTALMNDGANMNITIGSAPTYRTVKVKADAATANASSSTSSQGTATITYKSGYVYGNNRSQEFKNNSVYTLTATPKAGYRFVSWSDGGAQTHDVTITGNATYTATFEALATNATITLTAGAGGLVSGAGTFNTNTQQTITATPNSGYGFKHWEDASHNVVSTNASYTFTLSQDVNYKAIFYAPGTITTVATYGTVTGGGSYNGGQQATLTVTPNDGYKFAKWSDENTDNPRTITVDGDKTYTAQFFDLNEPLIASFSWDDDDISVESYGDGNSLCTSFYSPAGKQFQLLYAKANSRSSKNYLNLSIQTAQTQSWGGTSWAKAGTYPVVSSGLTTGSCNYGTYWYWTLNQSNVCVAYGYDSYDLGLNELGSYVCDKSGNAGDASDQSNYLSVSEGITCIIEEGENGDPFIRLIRNTDQQCLVRVGNPAPAVSNHTITINPTTHGTLTVTGGVTDYNNGSAGAEIEAADGATLTVTATPAEGYHFDAWQNDGAASVTVDGDKTIGATFAANHYGIAFSGNGGKYNNSIFYTQDGFEYDQPQALPANKFVKQYTVTYDYAGATGGNTVASDVVTFDFVNWKGTGETYFNDQQEVTNLKSTDGYGSRYAMTAQWSATGSNVTLPTPTKTGYTFDGWYSGAYEVGNAGASYTCSADKTLTAHWIAKSNTTYTVEHYQENLGDDEYTIVDTDNLTGTTDTEITPATKNYTGFTAPVATTMTIAADGSAVMRYYYTRNRCTVTITSTDKGNVSVTDNVPNEITSGNEVKYGTQLTLNCEAIAPAVFTGWSVTPVGNFDTVEEEPEADAPRRAAMDGPMDLGLSLDNVKVIIVKGDITITANFSTKLTVTIHPADNGTITVRDGEHDYTSGTHEFNEGTALTLTLTPAGDGYDYGEWTDQYEMALDPYGTPTTKNITLTENLDLYAQFMKESFTLVDNASCQTAIEALPEGIMIRKLTYTRTLKPDTWSTMCLPLTSYIADNESLAGKIHTLFDATVSGNNVNVKFTKAEAVEAGVPYMFYCKEEGLTDPVFDYAVLDANAEAGSLAAGDVTYYGVLFAPAILPASNSAYRYISSNKLYFPTSAKTMSFARGYFHIDNGTLTNAPMRISIDENTIEDADVEVLETKKYIENGILIIEREGVKYDAQGNRINL